MSAVDYQLRSWSYDPVSDQLTVETVTTVAAEPVVRTKVRDFLDGYLMNDDPAPNPTPMTQGFYDEQYMIPCSIPATPFSPLGHRYRREMTWTLQYLQTEVTSAINITYYRPNEKETMIAIVGVAIGSVVVIYGLTKKRKR